jgi:hypothetical protein
MYREPLVCAPSRAELWFGPMNLRWISIGAAALVAALAGGLWIWTARSAGPPPEPGPVAAAPDTSVEARLAALQQELAAERDARLGLETEVEMLRLMLEESGGAARLDAPAGGTAPSAGAAPQAGSTAAEAGQAEPEANPPNLGGRLWFDAPALARSGVPPHEIARLERLFEESELAVLQLRDRATREGWAETPRFPQELYELRAGLRAEVGDETFDWLLYATQRPNRVSVRSLLSNGAAAQAGVQQGDLILSYDGRTIFRGGELQHATRQGAAGRPVPIDKMSPDGEVRRVMVPSGPLGILLGEQRLPPQTGR